MRRQWQRSRKDSGPLDRMAPEEGSREVSGFKTTLKVELMVAVHKPH